MHNRFLTSHLILLAFLLLAISGRAVSDEWLYSVKEGDTLWGLTSSHLLNASYLKKVQQLNNISNPLDLPTGSTIKIPTQWLKPVSIPVYADAIAGAAELVKKEGGRSALKKGDLIGVGDSVRTKHNSSVILKFKDESSVTVEENSDLEVEILEQSRGDNKRKVQLHLKKGRVETHVNSIKKSKTQFIIKTPVSVTSVRGTRYRVSAMPEDNVSHTEVIEGVVDVSNVGESQKIPKSYGTVVLKGVPPQAPIKLLAPPSVKDVPTTFRELPTQFALPDLEEKQKYRVQIVKTDAFQIIIFNKSFSSSDIHLPELADATYQVRIRRIDKHGLEGKNAQFTIVVNTEPKAPTLLAPKSEEGFAESDITFSWKESHAEQIYSFQLSSTEEFSQLLASEDDISSPSIDWDKDLEEGKYFWRVAAVDKDGKGPFSESHIFYKKSPAPKIDSVKMIQGELSINFSHSPSAERPYQIQIADNKGFTNPVLYKKIDTSTLKSSPLEPGRYYIRVRAVEKGGKASPFAKTQILDIPKENNQWLWILPFLAVLIFIAVKFR